MASFVEQATLRIDDQSTKQIKSINRELKSLFKTAGRLKAMKFDVGGITQAQKQIKSLNGQLRKLPKSRTINVNINQKGAVPKVPRQQRAAPPQNFSARGSRGNVFTSGSNLSIARAVITSYGAIKVGSAALTAVNDAQAQDTKERSIFRNDQATQNVIDAAGRQAALNTPRIDYTRGRGIATDLAVGGVKPENVPAFTSLFANTEASVGALFPGLEKSVTLFNNKMVNLANASDDITRSAQLVKGGAQGIAAAGESFNAPTTIAALRTANLLPTIDAEGLSRFILIADAMGQQAGSSTNRLRKELFTPTNQAGAGSGISKGAVANLNERGMRGYSTEEQAAFGRDPVKFIQEILAPRIKKQGVDINDRSALDKYLQSAGFNSTSQRLIMQAATSMDEINQQLKTVSGIDPSNPNAGTEGNIALASDNLIKSFNTLSSQVLVPLAEKAAPLVNGLSDYIEKVSLTGSGMEKLKLGVEGAAAAFVAYKAGSQVLSAIFNPLNASAGLLSGSAGALTRAAVALGGAGVAGSVGAGAGVAAAGVAAKGAGVGRLLLRGAGIVGVAITANDILGAIDPKGNLWGLTATIDDYLKKNLRFDPSDMGAYATSGNLPKSSSLDPNVTPPVPLSLGGFGPDTSQLPNRFEQAFGTGAVQAGTTLQGSIEAGAQGFTGALANAFAAGADILASRITGAINNAVINAPRPAAVSNVGVTAPRE